MILSETKIGVVGLGYVGLPLALAFAQKFPVVGFDIDTKRISNLEKGIDDTREIDPSSLVGADLSLSSSVESLSDCNVFVVTVPTPVDRANKPDLEFLLNACKSVGKMLKKGCVVIFESTVFPGCTEETCVPILERVSGLKLNQDFFCGYSPERINPGDKTHNFNSIVKITSGSNDSAAQFVDDLYGAVVDAGTYRAESIKVAESAKVIENIQRDINIALINELSIIFDKMSIDTRSVITAAATKWNFLPFQPGLVGGHCIGVDPYYLAYKAQELGLHAEMVLSGRRINDRMPSFVADKLIKSLIKKGKSILDVKILVCGGTFKENCPDLRNTKVKDLIDYLNEYGCRVFLHDPWMEKDQAEIVFSVEQFVTHPKSNSYDAVLLSVPHKCFLETGAAFFRDLLADDGLFFDMKAVFPVADSHLRI